MTFLKNNLRITSPLPKNSFSLKNPLLWAFVLPGLYWFYLLFSSNMEIVYDGWHFQELGTLLYQKGWMEYLKTGPNNEPVFPLLIAFSMRIAELTGISYQKIQTVIHILCLLLTQILCWRILKKLQIHPLIIAVTIIYLGCSPALVNATFSLWSEIAAFPFVIGIVLVSIHAWQSIEQRKPFQVILSGFLLAFLFIGATSVKALFEYIIPCFMIPFYILIMRFFLTKQYSRFKHSLLFCILALGIFELFVFGYKSLNQKYNGHFMLTNRGPYILYGTVSRQTDPLARKEFLLGLSYIPGDGVCHRFFGKERCSFWSLFTVEGRGSQMEAELKKTGVSEKEIDQQLINLAKQKILDKPFQYSLLTFLESLKMFFWESTKIGYVEYPPFLKKLFNITLFKDGLRLLLSLLTILSFFYSFVYIFKNKNQIFNDHDPYHQQVRVCFLILVLLIFTIGFYSLFFVNTRYASPIAPLFLVLIAFSAQRIFNHT